MTEADATKRSAKAVASVRDAASKAVATTTATTRAAADKAVAGIEANPLAVLGGGIALGALASVFVPHTAAESKILRPVGKRLKETARGAVDAARDTARAEFDILGLSRNAARNQVGKLLGGVLKALATAGTAALAARTVVDQAPQAAAKPSSDVQEAPEKAPTTE